MSRRVPWLLALSSLVVFAGTLAAESSPDQWWPQFRGPNGSGVAASGDYPTVFGDTENLLWKVEVPSGVSSPCVWEDRIFLTAYNKEHKKLETICLSRDTGALVWRREVPAEKIERVHSASSPASATPATDGERVYVYFGSYGLEAYDLDGTRVWTRPLGMARNRWGMGTSPIVAHGLLILACDQGGRAPSGVNRGVQDAKSYLLAVNRLTGETAWRIERPQATSGWSTPIVWRQDGGDQLVIYSTTRVMAYDFREGEELWRVNRLAHDSVPTPVVGEEMLFVAGTVLGGDQDTPIAQPFDDLLAKADEDGDGKLSVAEAKKIPLDPRQPENTGFNYGAALQMVDTNKDGFATKAEWGLMLLGYSAQQQVSDQLVAIRAGAKGNATRTHVAWRLKRGIPDNASPLYYDGHVYLVKSGGIISCLDAQTGKRVYRKRIGPAGEISASPVVADGRIYCASEGGRIVVFQSGPGGKVLAKNELSDRIMATPALVDGKIYVRTDRYLYAFGRDALGGDGS